MRFADFLRTTVLLSAGSASLLAAITLAGTIGGDHGLVLPIALGWWIVAGLIGVWLGRRAGATTSIASLLAAARTRASLPEVNPGRTMLNRLWPLLVSTVGAAALGVVLPQVASIAAGFAIIWALAWRHQSSAVTAIEERDGARFYIERTAPWQPIALVRTPGFRSNLRELDAAATPRVSRS